MCHTPKVAFKERANTTKRYTCTHTNTFRQKEGWGGGDRIDHSYDGGNFLQLLHPDSSKQQVEKTVHTPGSNKVKDHGLEEHQAELVEK